jgi:hypothetical protein
VQPLRRVGPSDGSSRRTGQTRDTRRESRFDDDIGLGDIASVETQPSSQYGRSGRIVSTDTGITTTMYINYAK